MTVEAVLVTFLSLFFIPSSEPDFPRPLPGDAEFMRMNYPRAEALYDSTLVFNADSAGILWRLARLYVCKGDVAGEESQHEIYLQAEGFARRSIAADSMQAAGYTWLAAALGSRAMREGSRNKVQLCNEIKRVLDIAVTLDSTDDVAYSIMGSFYLALGNISWIERQLAAVFIGRLPSGGYAEAEPALDRAVRLAPEIIRHRYEIGLLYEAMERREEAREAFRRSTELVPQLASDAHTQQLAREWLEKH